MLKPILIPPFLSGRSAVTGRFFCVLGVALWLVTTVARAESHSFTQTNGNAFAGEIIAVQNTEVDVKQADGKTYRFEILSLSSADREYVRAWKEEADKPKDGAATTESYLEIGIALNPAATGADTPATQQAKVTLTNRDTHTNFKGLQGTLIIVAQEAVPMGRFKILARETFACDLLVQGKYDFTSQSFSLAVTDPVAGPAPFKYRGYLFILQNAANEVIQFRRSWRMTPSAMHALALQTGLLYNLRFMPIGERGATRSPAVAPAPKPATTP